MGFVMGCWTGLGQYVERHTQPRLTHEGVSIASSADTDWDALHTRISGTSGRVMLVEDIEASSLGLITHAQDFRYSKQLV